MTTKTALLLINPESGGVARLGPAAIEALVREKLGDAGYEITVIQGATPDLIDHAGAARETYDLVLPAGGDGTVAGIAGSLRHASAALLCIPCGTVNLLCRDLGIPLDLAAALDVCLAGEFRQIDVGVANGRAFVNNLVVGAYAQLAEAREDVRAAGSIGELGAAVGTALDALMNADATEYRITVDGQSEHSTTNTIGVFNNPVSGALNMLPSRSTLNSGKLSIYLTDSRHALDFAGVLASFAAGRVEAAANIHEILATRCKITRPDGMLLYSHDGDPLEVEGVLDCTIDASSLRVLCPAKPTDG